MAYRVLATLFVALALATPPALAQTQILSVTAQRVVGGPDFDFVNGLPPALTRNGVTTLGDGALAKNTLYIVPEAQGVTLKDTIRPGSGNLVAAGTVVDSFYVCADSEDLPAGGARNGVIYSGIVEFDNPDLLAVVLRPPQLRTTAKALGRPGVRYTYNRFIGVDPFDIGQDDHNFSRGTFRFFGDVNGIDCRRLIFRAKG